MTIGFKHIFELVTLETSATIKLLAHVVLNILNFSKLSKMLSFLNSVENGVSFSSFSNTINKASCCVKQYANSVQS